MMKTFLTILGLLLIIQSYGQDTLRRYQDADSSMLVAEFVINNETQKPDGMFKSYFENGSLKEHRIFKNGLFWETILLNSSDGEKEFRIECEAGKPNPNYKK